MNLFRGAGDFLHVIAITLLLLKICISKSCAGISGRTQVLFLLVFVTRYLDVGTNFVSYYNRTMKIAYITSAAATVFLIFYLYRGTYDRKHDTMRSEFLLLLAFMLGLYINHMAEMTEVAWSFSIYLESVAILPQFHMIFKTGEVEYTMVYYLLAMACYRALYIGNWIWRYHYEGFFDEISTASGVVQTLVYFSFFFLFFKYKENANSVPESEEKNVGEKTVQSNEPPIRRNFVRIRYLQSRYVKICQRLNRLLFGTKGNDLGPPGAEACDNRKPDLEADVKPQSLPLSAGCPSDSTHKGDAATSPASEQRQVCTPPVLPAVHVVAAHLRGPAEVTAPPGSAASSPAGAASSSK